MEIPLRIARISVFIIGCFLALAQQALAFCLAPQLGVSDEFYASDLVLTGMVTRSQNIVDPKDPYSSTGTLYTVSVDTFLRGEAGSVIKSIQKTPQAVSRWI